MRIQLKVVNVEIEIANDKHKIKYQNKNALYSHNKLNNDNKK